jgi:hypothetical protein
MNASILVWDFNFNPLWNTGDRCDAALCVLVARAVVRLSCFAHLIFDDWKVICHLMIIIIIAEVISLLEHSYHYQVRV